VALFMPLVNDVTGKELSVWRFGEMRSIMYLLGFSLVAGILDG